MKALSPSNRDQIEALAHVFDALRRHEQWCRKNHLAVPASVSKLIEEINFRVSRGQDGSTDAASLPDGHGGSEVRLMLRFESAARMLEVSVSTIKRLVADGRLTAVHVGGASRIRVADLEHYVADLDDNQREDDVA